MFQLVKNTTTSIKSLDTWIVHLHYEHKALRRSVKDDEKEELWKKEVAEIKEQVQSVKSVSTNRRFENHADLWTSISTSQKSWVVSETGRWKKERGSDVRGAG